MAIIRIDYGSRRVPKIINVSTAISIKIARRYGGTTRVQTANTGIGCKPSRSIAEIGIARGISDYEKVYNAIPIEVAGTNGCGLQA